MSARWQPSAYVAITLGLGNPAAIDARRQVVLPPKVEVRTSRSSECKYRGKVFVRAQYGEKTTAIQKAIDEVERLNGNVLYMINPREDYWNSSLINGQALDCITVADPKIIDVPDISTPPAVPAPKL